MRNQLLEKRQLFAKEIKKKFNKNYMSEVRNSLLFTQQINQRFYQYLNHQIEVVPLECSENIALIYFDKIAMFAKQLLENRIVFSKQKCPDVLNNVNMFDYTKTENLKFARECIKINAFKAKIFESFLDSTLQGLKIYSQFKHQVTTNKSSCIIRSSPKKILQNNHSLEVFRETLALWSAYLKKSSQVSLGYDQIDILMKSFVYWVIIQQMQLTIQCWNFMEELLQYVNLAKQDFFMVQRVKWFSNTLKFDIFEAIKRNQNNQPADVLTMIIKNEELAQQYFKECLFTDRIGLYIYNLLNNQSQNHIISALKLLNQLLIMHYNIIEVIQKELYCAITQVIFQLLKQTANQTIEAACCIVLQNLVSQTEENRILLKFFENVQFLYLLSKIRKVNIQLFYNLMIKIIKIYLDKKMIHQMFQQCEFHILLKNFCQQNDEQINLFIEFIQILDHNLDYLMDNHKKIMIEIRDLSLWIESQEIQLFTDRIKERCLLLEGEERL